MPARNEIAQTYMQLSFLGAAARGTGIRRIRNLASTIRLFLHGKQIRGDTNVAILKLSTRSNSADFQLFCPHDPKPATFSDEGGWQATGALLITRPRRHGDPR
jgi:hypothetical protein